MFFLDSEYVGKGGCPLSFPPKKLLSEGNNFKWESGGGDPPNSPLKNRPEMAK